MSELGDSTKSYSFKKNDILVNSNGKGCHSEDFKASRNSLEAHSIESFPDDDDNDEKVSLRSASDSTKFREVDRFGFVGGNQYTNPNSGPCSLPIEILRLRELKWLDMLENWDKWMTKKFTKVKERCQKGIPDSLRARAWQLLTGSAISLANNPGRYQGYLDSQGNPLCLDEIKKDVSRQYPHHELFMDDNGQGQEDLYSVLMAYSVHDPSVGYCQAQGPLAAVLLTLMPAEQAFWMFVMICEKYLPGYYNAGLEAVQIDSMILFGLLKKACPQAYKHLKHQKVEPILWMTDWFMCLYSRTLPWSSVLRIWDMFMCEGVKVMFRVALVLVKSVLGTSQQIKSCPTFYDSLDRLRKIPAEFMEENYLAREMSKLQISDKDMEKEHAAQLKKWNISKAQKVQKNNSSKVPTTSVETSKVTMTTQDSNSNTTVIPVTATCSEISAPKVTSSTSSTSTCSSLDSKNLSSIPMDSSNHEVTSHHDLHHHCKPPPNPILPPPGSLLLPRVISSSPSLKPLISLPVSTGCSSTKVTPPIMVPTPPVATKAMNFLRSTSQASSDSLQSQKEKRLSKRFPFSSKLKLAEKNKAEAIAGQIQDKSLLTRMTSEAEEGVAKEMPTNHEPFKRYQYKPSMSPCSSLTAVPQISDKKKTFRMSWHRSKTSKSTTNIDQ